MSKSKSIAFLDCEFTSLDNPRLLSLALVVSPNDFFYGELDTEELWAQANTFVLDIVKLQWNRIPSSFGTAHAMANALNIWIDNHPGSIDICYDYHADMDLLEELLIGANHWGKLKNRLQPTHVGYLHSVESMVMSENFAATQHTFGIEQHHALADAFALQALFNEVHGGDQK